MPLSIGVAGADADLAASAAALTATVRAKAQELSALRQELSHLLARDTTAAKLGGGDRVLAPTRWNSTLPSRGLVALIVRGEAFRFDVDEVHKKKTDGVAHTLGCQPQAAPLQEQATRSLVRQLVWPLERRLNHVHIFATETSGVCRGCILTRSLRPIFAERPANRSGYNRVRRFNVVKRQAGQAESLRLALDTFKNASGVPAPSAYDLFLLVRFDMVWTMPIDKWPPPADFRTLSFLGPCRDQERFGPVDTWGAARAAPWAALNPYGIHGCMSDLLMMMPGKMFEAFDGVVGRRHSMCYDRDVRGGAGHGCFPALATATGSRPGFVTDYASPNGTLRRATPLGWIMGTPITEEDQKSLAAWAARGQPDTVLLHDTE
jgi:hypothetical protein